MVRDKVILDFGGTSPHDITERASSPGHVYVLHVPVALLSSTKIHRAIWTDGPLPQAATDSMRSLVLSDAWDGYVPLLHDEW